MEDAEMRMTFEAAIVESLESVLNRAEHLQQHLGGLPGTARLVRPGDLGSPERLRAFAMGAAWEPHWVAGVGTSAQAAAASSAAAPLGAGADTYHEDAGVPDDEAHHDELMQPSSAAAAPTAWHGPENINRAKPHPNLHEPLQGTSIPNLRKRAIDGFPDDGWRDDHKRMAVLATRAEAATARADAACGVLHRLVERTCAPPARSALGAAAERGASWIRDAEERLLAWVEEQRRRQSASELRVLLIDAQLRDERSNANAACERERSRAERAEGRCRKLVRALRTTSKDAVDEVEVATGGYGPPPAAMQRAPSQSECARSERWARQREVAANVAKADPKAVLLRKQALTHQLTLPGMGAAAWAAQVRPGRF